MAAHVSLAIFSKWPYTRKKRSFQTGLVVNFVVISLDNEPQPFYAPTTRRRLDSHIIFRLSHKLIPWRVYIPRVLLYLLTRDATDPPTIELMNRDNDNELWKLKEDFS